MKLVGNFNSYRSKINAEIISLSCSIALLCDDCFKYHLEKCFELGINKEELFKIFAIANLIGGTIVIPHFRKEVEYRQALDW